MKCADLEPSVLDQVLRDVRNGLLKSFRIAESYDGFAFGSKMNGCRWNAGMWEAHRHRADVSVDKDVHSKCGCEPLYETSSRYSKVTWARVSSFMRSPKHS